MEDFTINQIIAATNTNIKTIKIICRVNIMLMLYKFISETQC